MRLTAIALACWLVALGPVPELGAEEPDRIAPDLVKREVLERAKGMVRCLSFHPALAVLAAGSADRSLRFWEADGSGVRKRIRIPRTLRGVP